jgi:hypothetical protein
MPKNQQRSRRGRSAVARSAMFNGPSPTTAFMPHTIIDVILAPGEKLQPRDILVQANRPDGTTLIRRQVTYFGGPKKGGMPPRGTGFMVARRWQIGRGGSAPATRPNYLFRYHTQVGRPWNWMR